MMAISRRVLAFGPWAMWLSLLASPGALAHDMWIVPPNAAAAEIAPGQKIEVRLRVGHGGSHEPVRRDPRRLLRFGALAVAAAAAEEPVAGIDGADPAGLLRPREAGLWAIVYESRAAWSELPADRFRRYLQEEGLDAIAGLRRQQGQEGEPGRELYSRSLKSLVRVGTAGGADRAVGLPLELVAETPSRLWGREPMVLRLLWQGEPLGDALVDLQSLDGSHDGVATARRTDCQGRVRFELGPGAWMAATVHMERDSPSSRADWRSVFSTLTWVIPDR